MQAYSVIKICSGKKLCWVLPFILQAKCNDNQHFLICFFGTFIAASCYAFGYQRTSCGTKKSQNIAVLAFVPWVGIEPTLPKELDFESSASTNSATKAKHPFFKRDCKAKKMFLYSKSLETNVCSAVSSSRTKIFRLYAKPSLV